jgi:RDD family
MEPRHFWRRLGAAVVDYLLATLVALAVIWPFLGDSDRLRLDAMIYTISTCNTVTSAPESLLAIVGDKVVDSAVVCDTQVMGRDNGLTVTLVYDVTRTENTSSQRTISVPVDSDGNPVAPMMPQSLIVQGVLVVAGGMLLTWAGRTPGKRLFGLKVVGRTPVPGVLREAIKLAPGVIFGLGMLALWVFGTAAYAAVAQVAILPVLAGFLVFGVVVFWLYALPILRWRGATRYDRWLGLSVVRA